MPPLLATPEMLQIAQNDKPEKTSRRYWWSGHSETVYIYQYPLHLRCLLLDGILKVSFYSVDSMRMGANASLYDLYIDKASGQFLTWNANEEKWQRSKLDRLEWPKSTWESHGRWISQEDRACINRYLGTDGDPYSKILSYQLGIREKELEARHKRETDAWDEELKQIGSLPKDWLHWVDKVGIPDQFIYYDYRRGGATVGYCSYCEKDVPIKAPRHMKEGRCPCCRHKIVYRALGKTGFLMTKERNAFLLQKVSCGFVIREFRVWRRHCKGEHKEPKVNCNEVRRAFFTADGKPISAYYWGVYKQGSLRWIKTDCCGTTYGFWYSGGRVYGKTIPQLIRSGLSRTGLPEYIKREKVLDPEYYLAVLKYIPQVEQLSKVGLAAMVTECLQNAYEYHGFFGKKRSGSLIKMLGINGQEFKRLRRCNGNMRFLKWLRLEKSMGKPIPDMTIRWFCEHQLDPDDVSFIFDRLRPAQIQHYLCRQMSLSGMDAKQTLITWKDYLNMAAGFHYDVNDAIVYRTPKLRQRHDELVARGIRKDRAIRAGEILTKFPHVDEICSSHTEKYSYAGEQYQVIAPEGVLDILVEGDMLHHCIGSSDRYFERIERRESYLLFLRKAEEPQRPYYTMEIEPNGTVRQLRTMYDRQNEDAAAARVFLLKWQKVVAERLTTEDRQKAEQSRILREQEFVQMRTDQVKIHTGDLAGSLLVDVLTADLMEAA